MATCPLFVAGCHSKHPKSNLSLMQAKNEFLGIRNDNSVGIKEKMKCIPTS